MEPRPRCEAHMTREETILAALSHGDRLITSRGADPGFVAALRRQRVAVDLA